MGRYWLTAEQGCLFPGFVGFIGLEGELSAVWPLNGWLPMSGVLGVAGLSSAWMLGWLAAAAIPLVLHLLNQRRQQPVQWAAMQLLLQVVEKESRRMRFEQLLLLILRMLILVVLAIALARPFLAGGGDEGGATARAPQLWIIAIDMSYSMDYRQDGTSRFELARQLALDALEEAQTGDAFSLVGLGDPAQAVIGAPTFDVEGFRGELRRMEPVDTGLDLSSALTLIQDIAGMAAEYPQLTPRAKVLIYSDLGWDGWQGAVEGVERTRLQQLRNKHEVEIESVASDEVNNVYIKAMRFSTHRALVGNTVGIDITVASAGASVTMMPVRVELDEQTVASDTVDLAEGEERVVRLQFVPRSLGSFALAAVLPDDRLNVDNRRYQILEVREQYRILIVENEVDDARMLKLALRPTATSGLGSSLTIRSRLELGSLELSNWDIVILNDLPSVSAEIASRLSRYVAARGSLIWLMGSRTNAASINAHESLSKQVLGFQLKQPSPIEDWGIDPQGYRSPIVAPFAGFPDSGLLTTPIFRFWQIQPTEPQSLVVDLATTDGQPLIVRNRFGQGWVAVMLTAPQTGLAPAGSEVAWNAMATWPSYLPLMQQLVQTVADTVNDRTTVLAGEPLRGVVRQAMERTSLKVVRPDRSENQITTDSTAVSGGLPWTYGNTLQSGLYRVFVDSGIGLVGGISGNGEQLFAVNIDPIQSTLERIDLSQLPAADESSIDVLAEQAGVVAGEADDWPAKVLLAGLLVLLVSESLLGWWMGRRLA
jgi:hypothetical protein